MNRKPSSQLGLTVEQVTAALTEAQGSPTRAARILGVTRNTVLYWIRTRKLSRSVIIVKGGNEAA